VANARTVTSKPKKKDNDTMTMKFLLHKNKEEKGKPSPQKQECCCPSLQSSLSSHTHAFMPKHDRYYNNLVKATTISGAKTIKY
jgi:hypothetical protein